MRTGLCVAAVVTLLCCLPASASAAGIVVNTTADQNGTDPAHCSLREAMASANANNAMGSGCIDGSDPDSITFSGLGADPQIDLTVAAPLFINSAVTVIGPGDLTVNASGIADRVLMVSTSAGTDVSISGITFTGGNLSSSSTAQGGGIFSTGDLTLTNVVVTDNHLTGSTATIMNLDGGGVFVNNGGTLTLDHSTISNNTVSTTSSSTNADSSARGAGIAAAGGTSITLHYSSVIGNTLTMRATGNTSEDYEASGGGIRSPGPLSADHSTIAGNTADAQITGTGTTGSSSLAQGAGLLSIDTLRLDTTTVANNRTIVGGGESNTQRGGGIGLNGVTPQDLVSTTIAGNGPDATSALQTMIGANIYFATGTWTVANSIIANPTGAASNQNCSFEANSANATNLDFAPGGESCIPDSANGVFIVDPLLGPLQDYGGPTPTMLPADDSPVIDQGDAADQTDGTLDQRGLTRPVDFSGIADILGGDASDIGAVEVQKDCATQATPGAECAVTPPGGGGTTTPPPAQQPAKKKKCKKAKKKRHAAAAKKKCKKKKKKR